MNRQWLVETRSGMFTQLLVNLLNIRNLFGIGTKLKESRFNSNSTIKTRTMVGQNGPKRDQVQIWYRNEKKNGIGSDRINKDEGDEVPPLCQCNFCEIPKGRSS